MQPNHYLTDGHIMPLSSPQFSSELILVPQPKNTNKSVLADLGPYHPLPMQYLGSKGRISKWIIGNLSKELPNSKNLVDLFAGTGSVSLEAINQGYNVILNDIQPYSYALLSSLFEKPKVGLPETVSVLQSFINKKSNLLRRSRKQLSDHLLLEDEFIKSLNNQKFNWKRYKKFCDSTPRLGKNLGLIKRKSNKQYDLFSWYYPNTYFGIRQCLEIDTIREFADKQDENVRAHILAAVISCLTFNVSSTTHLAQFIKPNNKKQAEFILKKRSKSIIESVIHRLNKLSEFNDPVVGTVYNLDYLDALKRVPNGVSTLVYADPPYFKEHYSRYYHVLDTFFLYDYPKLTLNPQTKALTEGIYRTNRIVSNFGLKSKVAVAFEDMLMACKEKGVSLAISYANTSLINKGHMKSLINKSGYRIVALKQKGLMHSAQGQPNNKIAQEFLYILAP